MKAMEKERIPRLSTVLDRKMKVEINLDDNVDVPKVYHVGDRISGTVRIASSTALHIGKLLLTFSGTAKTESVSLPGILGGSISFDRGQVLLFQDQAELFHGPYSLKPDTYEWPFTFIFPRTCLPRRDVIELNSSTYELDQSIALLPCFVCEISSSPTVKTKCSIAYTLTTSLIDHRGQTADKTLDLKFRTYPPPCSTTLIQRNADTVRKSFSCRSLRLNSPVLNRAPTFMEKLKASIITNDVPYAAFALILTIPTLGIAGRPLAVTFALHHNLEKTTALSSPEITLTSLSLSLEPKTTTRDWITGRGLQFPRPDKPALWGHQLNSFGRPEHLIDAKCKIPIRENLVLADHFQPAIPNDQIPTFKSLNIERVYGLCFQAEVECAGFNLNFTHRVSDFVILSGEEAPENELQELDMTLAGTATVGDELPPYVA